jgi:hypothetical protein
MRDAEIYDPGDGRWTALPPMASPRYAHAGAMLPDGRVAVFGSQTRGTSCEALDLGQAPPRWAALPPMAHGRAHGAACLLPAPEAGGDSSLAAARLHTPGGGGGGGGVLLVGGGKEAAAADEVLEWAPDPVARSMWRWRWRPLPKSAQGLQLPEPEDGAAAPQPLREHAAVACALP